MPGIIGPLHEQFAGQPAVDNGDRATGTRQFEVAQLQGDAAPVEALARAARRDAEGPPASHRHREVLGQNVRPAREIDVARLHLPAPVERTGVRQVAGHPGLEVDRLAEVLRQADASLQRDRPALPAHLDVGAGQLPGRVAGSKVEKDQRRVANLQHAPRHPLEPARGPSRGRRRRKPGLSDEFHVPVREDDQVQPRRFQDHAPDLQAPEPGGAQHRQAGATCACGDQHIALRVDDARAFEVDLRTVETDPGVQRIERQAQAGRLPDHFGNTPFVFWQQLECEPEGADTERGDDRERSHRPRQPAPCSCSAETHVTNVSLGACPGAALQFRSARCRTGPARTAPRSAA